ncbi:g11185 [Coccomyxa viridis]|uniref:G11185 protein n=1 Tax=Coccomyxa viridis TaxID=1274662 RepID=A0ABP1G7A8_9CHLO
MATAQQVETVIRASEPDFRNKHDQLAFAVHAYLIADGYRLTATGKAADVPDEEIPEDKKRSSVKGWNHMEDGYAFRYEDPTGKRNPLMVKMVPMDGHLLLQWMAPKSFKEPRLLDLDVNNYVDAPSDTAGDDPAAGYKSMDDLVAKLRQTFHGHAAEAAAKQQPAATVREAIPEAVAPAAQSLRSDAPGTSRSPAPDMDDDYLLREGPRNAGPRTGGIPPVPSIGTDDLHPPMPGIPREFPGPDDIPYSGGLGGPERPGGIGGMYVGPDDPIFAGRFPGRGGMGGDFGPGISGRGRGRGSFPGAIWDPIAPPGMPGFRPEDFQRGARGNTGRGDVHPDVMPPGPGHFDDSMFG